MAWYVGLTILLMSILLSPNAIAQQSQWISNLDQSKKLSKYGREQNLEYSVGYCVKALAEARQLPSATARNVALEQIREQFQRLQFEFDSASRWDWAEQVTKWLLDIDLKNHQTSDSLSMSSFQAASDYGKLAKYAVMQGRTSEGEKYAAQEKEMKERPLRQAKQQSAEMLAKLQKQLEAAKEAQAKTSPSGNASNGNPSSESPSP